MSESIIRLMATKINDGSCTGCICENIECPVPAFGSSLFVELGLPDCRENYIYTKIKEVKK